MQLYPDSIVLEGADRVLDSLGSILEPQALFLCLNEIPDPGFFRLPNPHLPDKPGVRPDGRYCFRPEPERYDRVGLVPPVATVAHLKNKDVLDLLVGSARPRKLKTYAWLQAFNLAPLVADNPEIAQVNALGKRSEVWACPCQQRVRDYNLALIGDLLSRYELAGIFLDRFRFPSFYDGPDEFLSCFCDHCRAYAQEWGFDLEEARDELLRLYHNLGVTSPDLLMDWADLFVGCGADGFVQAVSNLPVARWFLFRFQLITSFVQEIYEYMAADFPDKELALDIWTPAYAWLVGQNYRQLAPYCSWIKPIVYPGDGPAGLAGELIALVSALQAVNPDLEMNRAVAQACRFFGFRTDKPLTVEGMMRRGISDDIYETELRRAKALMNQTRPLRAGCPVFDGSPKRVRDRIKRAQAVKTDGIILYAYDLAPLEHLEAAGKALRD